MERPLDPGELEKRNRRYFDGPFAAFYDFYMSRPRVSELGARTFWNSSTQPYYASMNAIAEAPAGATIVDAPCGSGVAFRALEPEQDVRYRGYDLSPGMLERAKRRADELGLEQIELAEADATALPLEDGTADLFLSYFGLHCFPDPEAALAEAARCLVPGGRLVGAMIVRGRRPLDRLRVRPYRGAFGPVGFEEDLVGWLRRSGFSVIETDRRGVFAVFRAVH